MAQEDTASGNGRVGNSLLRDDTAGSTSEARLRFTELVLPGGEGQHFHGGASLGWLALTDCQLLGGSFNFCYGGSYARTAGLTNNVFERVRTSLGYYGDAALIIHGRNNLFWNCPVLDLTPATAQTGWEWRENCLVGCTVYQYGSVQNSHNGYLGTTTLNGSSGGDQTLTASPFVSGALGPWHLDPASPLINAGNRLAGAAGLYHHTTQAGQAKEAGTAVDIGFHYMAVTPAGPQIALTGTSLTASSQYYNGQWNAPNAKNGLTTDPGWHNSGYTGTSEYLRADLGTSQPVGSVAYVPRVMAADWTGGSWNGAYRQYAIQVTDSASNDPADWGTPVATGEWYWPNLQERKDVTFPARTGRYAYFRRIEAWGMFTRQAGQINPGYACANEVWIHSPATATPEAVDTDHDGLADYLEDANGDGVRQLTETDPINPVSDPVSGRFDGEPVSVDYNPFPRDYQNTTKLRYFTGPSRPNDPDADFTMRWWSWARACTLNRLGDFTLVPTSGTDREGKDYLWRLGESTLTSWAQLRGGTTTSTTTENIPRPPSAEFAVPWEHCNWVTFYRPDSAYSREAHTKVFVKGPRTWPAPMKSVVLSVTVTDKSDGSTIEWPHTYFLHEPDDRSSPTTPSIDPAFRDILVGGRVVDANGLVLVQVKKTGDKEVSAVVSGPSWYQYDISPSSPWQVRMTWSRHPACGSVDLQAMFDEATLYLAEDNDDRVKDDDSRLNDPAFRDGDDVPTYMEFLDINVRQPTFPSAYSTIGGTIDFTQAAYCNVQDFNHLDNLLYADLANVKLVDKILIDGIHYAGRAYPGVPGIVLAKQCNLGGTSMPLDWLTVIHEYGHSAGLEHRGWVIPPPTGHQPNPGDWEDTTAVMHYQHAGGKEVNRFEQTKFTTWNPALWNPPPAP